MRWLVPLAVWLAGASAHAGDDGALCARLGDRSDRTIIVFEPPASFAICRGGASQANVLAGRRVYFELLPRSDAAMFEFRLHGRATEVPPSSLAAWRTRADALANALEHLARSGETIGEMPPPPQQQQAMSALAVARSLYLAIATARFHKSLGEIISDVRALPELPRILRGWCREIDDGPSSPTPALALLRASCAAPEVHDDTVESETTALLAAATDFETLRAHARSALLAVEANPLDPAAQAEAKHALDEALARAVQIVEGARRLAPLASGLGRDAAVLREVVHAPGLLLPRVAVPLATYPHAGNVALEIEARPVGILELGAGVVTSDTTIVTHRFEVVESHYIDVEAGLGITGGLPQIPSVATENGKATVVGKDVDQFVALALVELEPARIFAPGAPLAGILRFPVLGIPLSRNPTENFFIGAGLGWTGVGSITAGPYLLREATLNAGGYPQDLPMGASLTSVTHPTIQVGYYLSASVDLVGLYHLVVPRHLGTFDATTGKEQ